MTLKYRVTVSGMTTEVRAKGIMEAVNKVLRTPHILDHINKTLSQHNTFTVWIDSITP